MIRKKLLLHLTAIVFIGTVFVNLFPSVKENVKVKDHHFLQTKVPPLPFNNSLLPAYPGIDEYINYKVKRLHLSPHSGRLLKPVRLGFGPIVNDVTSFTYPIDLKRCKSVKNRRPRSLFIAIVTAPNNFERRKMIRQTWLNQLKKNQNHQLGFELFGVAFVMGQTANKAVSNRVKKEASIYKDIIQIAMIDGYYNLSLKVAALFNWINKKCSKVDFLLKIDDDVYVHSTNLATTLSKLSPSDDYIYGLYVESLIPNRRIRV